MTMRTPVLWIVSLLAMFAAILVLLFGLLRLVGSAGSRADAVVPMIVAIALAILAIRGVSTARDRDARAPVRTSHASRRARWIFAGVLLAVVTVLAWQSYDYSSACTRIRKILATEVLGSEARAIESLAAEPGVARACIVPAGASPELCEHRSSCSIGLRARVWRWLYWQAAESRPGAPGYAVVDDGEVVQYIFRR